MREHWNPIGAALLGNMRWVVVSVVLLLLTACGDITGTTGEFGRVDYELYTHYNTNAADLGATAIVTAHTQKIRTELTANGERVARDAELVEHRVDPTDGVELVAIEDGNDIPDFEVFVSEAGVYAFESYYDGTLLDRVMLTFDKPSSLDVITWLRHPNGEAFNKLEVLDSATVEEGSQVAFLPIPVDESGTRLAGDLDVELSSNPENATVMGSNVFDVYEETVVNSPSPETLYFIDGGLVEVSIEDRGNGLEALLVFDVVGIDGDE